MACHFTCSFFRPVLSLCVSAGIVLICRIAGYARGLAIAGGVSALIQMRLAVEKAICGFSASYQAELWADVYLGAWRWSAWGAWSARVCARPHLIAQCWSSKGVYPTACALFVIGGPLIPGDVLGFFEA